MEGQHSVIRVASSSLSGYTHLSESVLGRVLLRFLKNSFHMRWKEIYDLGERLGWPGITESVRERGERDLRPYES